MEQANDRLVFATIDGNLSRQAGSRALQELCRKPSTDWYGGMVVGQFRMVQDKQQFVRTNMIKSIEDDTQGHYKTHRDQIFFSQRDFVVLNSK